MLEHEIDPSKTLSLSFSPTYEFEKKSLTRIGNNNNNKINAHMRL